MKSELIFIYNKNVDLLYYEEKGFQQKQTDNDVKFSTITKGCKLYNINSTFVSPIYTFFAGKHNCLHANSRYKEGKVHYSYYV